MKDYSHNAEKIISAAAESIITGQYKEASKELYTGCRTKPAFAIHRSVWLIMRLHSEYGIDHTEAAMKVLNLAKHLED